MENFLEGSFEDSTLYAMAPSTGGAWFGLLVGASAPSTGIGAGLLLLHRSPRHHPRACATASAASTTSSTNKWYFDELLNALVYRPVIAVGRFANDVLERVVVQGIVNGTVGAVRGLGVSVRGAQTRLRPGLRAAA